VRSSQRRPPARPLRARCGEVHTPTSAATSCFALIPVASNLAATVPATRARVAKLVDAAGLKPVAGQLAGSNPAPGTTAQRAHRWSPETRRGQPFMRASIALIVLALAACSTKSDIVK